MSEGARRGSAADQMENIPLVLKHPDGRLALRQDFEVDSPILVETDDSGAWTSLTEARRHGFERGVVVTSLVDSLEAAWEFGVRLPDDATIPSRTPFITRWSDGSIEYAPDGSAFAASALGIDYERRLISPREAAPVSGPAAVEAILREYLLPDFNPRAVSELADRIARAVGR